MHKRFVGLAKLVGCLFFVTAILISVSCKSPLDVQAVGYVTVDFSTGQGASRAAGVLPADIKSVVISVKADDMDEITKALTAPALSATLDVPAGAARQFEVVARNADELPLYHGKQTLDIEAGAEHALSVTMNTLYKLSYDANGAGSGSVPDALYRATSDVVTVAPNSGLLAKAGFTFGGWNTAVDGLGTQYAPGENLIMPIGAIVLYAKWNPLSSAKDITAFGFAVPAVTGVISGTSIAVTVPFGTNVTSLSPVVTHTGTGISPALDSAIDFSAAVTFIVAAADSTTKTYTVTVTVAPNTAKDITSFSITSPAATGVITGTGIAVTVPFGTPVTSLIPAIIFTGATCIPGPGVAQNFTSPVTYTVTAADSTTKVYLVTVSVAPSNTKDITAFDFISPVATGTFSGTDIAVTVPFGTDVTSLVPTITHDGASISPLSGVAQNFTSPVAYTVTAVDASTKVFTVTVTVEPSNNANLMAVGGLVISGITLAPAFDPAIMSYTASADSSVPSVTVTATRADSGASIQVKVNSGSFTAITSGTPTGALILDNPAGMNTISVLVTAADTVTTKTYVVTIAKTVLVTINANTNGTVNLPGSVERTPGSPLAVTSIPDAGYRFKSWSGDIGYLSPPTSATTTLNVPISAVTTVTANFELDIFADGDGTAGDPFHITTLAHLIDMNSYRDKAFVLMANIDLISQPNWLPIGDTTTKFTGRFDGNGYTLSNLTINVTFDENRGLFGFTNGAIISNVTLSSINFSSTYNYAGGLIGRTTGNTQVTDCSVQGTISAYQSTGGLIGYSDSGSTLAVLRCSSAVTITSAYTGGLGGLIGRTEGGSVSQSSATGNLVGHVAGTQNYTGGLIGWNQNTSVIDSYATGMVDGDDGTGGLIGYNTGSSSVTNCYSAGAVTGTANIGGLIGYDSGTTITSAYYDQTASGRNDTGKGEPLLTTDMQNSATVGTIYPGWNFSTIWEILLTAYPTFK